MKKYVVIEKRVGETPLQALEVFRASDQKLRDLSLTYAGRLDPMASGKLLVLIGDECKNRKQYDSLDKEYEFEVLFGFETDTGDVLGLSETCEDGKGFSENEIKKVIQSFLGEHVLPYPAFSSKTVQGVPLFHHAIKNSLDDIEMPTARVSIYRLQFCGVQKISGTELMQNIFSKINLLHLGELDSRPGSGFRKEEILARWQSFQNADSKYYVIAKFKASVSSGTYIRSLAPLIAKKLGTCGLAYSIHRTKVGQYVSLTKSLGFWRKKY